MLLPPLGEAVDGVLGLRSSQARNCLSNSSGFIPSSSRITSAVVLRFGEGVHHVEKLVVAPLLVDESQIRPAWKYDTIT